MVVSECYFYLFVFIIIIININTSININSHPFFMQLFTFLTEKMELSAVSTTAVIHVSADVNKDPNIEQKTQNVSHNFLEHICTQVHSVCAFYLQYLRMCLSTLPLKEKLKVNVLGKSLICVSCNFNGTIFTTTIQVKRKHSYILNCPMHKTTALIMLFFFLHQQRTLNFND